MSRCIKGDAGKGKAMGRHFINSSGSRTIPVCEALEVRVVLAAATGPVVSELLASNINGLTDQDGAHSDWIELFNPTSTATVLDGWGLTDDATLPLKWTFPDNLPTAEVTLPAGGRMVVFASNKNLRIPGCRRFLGMVHSGRMDEKQLACPLRQTSCFTVLRAATRTPAFPAAKLTRPSNGST
jgi:hypothetical protein